MATWGFFHHPREPIKEHPHPFLGKVVAGMNSLLMAGAAGLGMFSEAYFLFAIGNIKTIWEVLYPTCFGATEGGTDSKSQCSEQLVTASTYVEVAGVIFGMLTFGVLAQAMGRRWASRGTATLMLIGGILLVVANGPTLTALFIVFNVGLFVFGFGTGGEYPTAASSAAERAELGERPKHERRGRLMVLTFAMQGWGNFVNTAVIAFFVAVTGNSNCPVASNVAATGASGASSGTNSQLCNIQGLDITWRVQYAIGLLVVIYMIVYRYCFLQESAIWKERRKQSRQADNRTSDSTLRRQSREEKWGFFTMKQYRWRLFGVSVCWYLSDVAFYGTKLFQGTLATATLNRENTILNVLIATLIYSAVSLAGYYLAALTMDHIGRTRIQATGFLIVGVLYLICGGAYNTLSTGGGRPAFAALFFVSSLFVQWGPNATTWLLPGELFPTPFRSEAHGIAASSGKLGALTASLVFSLANAGRPVSAQVIFIVGGVCCLVGWLMTVIFVPDTTHLSLKEVDRRWDQELAGQQYYGPAVCWENLSFFECWLFGVKPSQSVKNLPPSETEGAEQETTGDFRPSKQRSGAALESHPTAINPV